MRATGGLAFGATNTKSKFLFCAICNASLCDLTPNCSPLESINRTTFSAILSFTFMFSLLISSHLRKILFLLDLYSQPFNYKKSVGTICTHTSPYHKSNYSGTSQQHDASNR